MKNICLPECGRNYGECKRPWSWPRILVRVPAKIYMEHAKHKSEALPLQPTCFPGVRTYHDKCKFVWSMWTSREATEMLVRVYNFLLTVLKWAEGLILYSWFLFTFRSRRDSKSPLLHFCGGHLKWQKIMKCKIWETLFMWAFGWDPISSV